VEEITDGNATRRFNDDRVRAFGARPDRLIVLICECDDPDCTDSVLLTSDEFRVRGAAPILHDRHLHSRHV
jgi:hypothetical protein